MQPLKVNQWDIWQASWVNDDPNAAKSKDRPVVVFSTTQQMNEEKIARCWCISSQNHPQNQPRLLIEKPSTAFSESGLDKTSWVYLVDEQHLTLSSPPFQYRRGSCHPFVVAGLKQGLKIVGQKPVVPPK